MDLTTIIGMVTGVGLILWSILSAGDLIAFLDIPSAIVVFGGTVSAVLITIPLPNLSSVSNLIRAAFLYQPMSPKVIIESLVDFANVARREGILALEKKIQDVDNEFLKSGIQLAVDGTEPELLREIMETEISYLTERHSSGQKLFDRLGTMAPAFGMIGTLIGLVLMLRSMDDPSTIGPSMAVALITTFYGAVLANLIFIPITEKLKVKSQEELLIKELMIEGILAIQSGDNPRIVQQKLVGFLAPAQRVGLEDR